MSGPGPVTHTDLSPVIAQITQEFTTGSGWSPQELVALTLAAQLLNWANMPPTQVVQRKPGIDLGDVKIGFPPVSYRSTGG